MGNKHKGKRVEWQIIETKFKDNAVVQVSKLPLKIPRYSFKVGTAQFDDDTGELRIGTRLTNFNVEEAALMLTNLAKKYVGRRDARIAEVEKAKAQAQARLEKNQDSD